MAKFCSDIFPGLLLFWRVVRFNASLWDVFFCFDGRLVSLPQVLCSLSIALHSNIHHRKVCSTPLWSWRGIDLFSLVSAPGVSSLWCLILTHGSNIYESWIFLGNLFRVYSSLACCTAQCFLVRFFLCFDGRLVSLPQVLCNVACSALDDSHHLKTCSTPLWSWRGNDLFSPVSASGVFCLWCVGITHGSNIFKWRNFARTFFPVYCCFGVL